ncbi:MAG: hypothetical protein ACI9BF_000093 [Candidatus Paceibacteria bacterium]|jgi:hypothetical protein
MFKRFVKNIRRKPKTARNKIALIIASVFTTCVFVVWLYNIPNRLSVITDTKNKDSSPIFSQLFDEIGDNLSSIKNSVSDDPDSEVLDEPLEGMFDVSATSSVVAPSETDQTEFGFSTDLPNVVPVTSTARAVRILITGSSTSPKSAEVE